MEHSSQTAFALTGFDTPKGQGIIFGQQEGNAYLCKNFKCMKVADSLLLKIDKSKKKAFLEILKWLDFVEVQTQKSVLQRFVKNAPKNIPLNYDDLVEEVMEHRYGTK